MEFQKIRNAAYLVPTENLIIFGDAQYFYIALNVTSLTLILQKRLLYAVVSTSSTTTQTDSSTI